MADDHDHGHGNIIIIKKKVMGGGGHHGGAWKIAFADFMTAMMAFFLVLWIINATDKETKTVIARYFNPVKLENLAKAKKGLHGETSAPTDGKEGKDEDKPATSNTPSSKAQKESKENNKTPPAAESKAESKADTAKAESKSAEAKAQAAEAQLFASPYEALDKIAGAPENTAPGAAPEKGDADPQRMAGKLSIEAFRDPFKPIGPGATDDPASFEADVRNNAQKDIEPGKTGQEDRARPSPAPNASANPTPQEKIAPGDAATAAPSPVGGPAESGAQQDGAKGGADAAKLEKELREKVAAALKSAAGPDIQARFTKDGLLISLTDKLDFSMFAIGSAEPRPELVRAMEAVAKIVKERNGHIVVRGYTDSRPYKNGAYDNWRLSSDRAQMAYYMLTRGGAPAARFTRVEGYADRAPRDPSHPFSAVNRRLEILVEEAKP